MFGGLFVCLFFLAGRGSWSIFVFIPAAVPVSAGNGISPPASLVSAAVRRRKGPVVNARWAGVR